jgi:glycogen debranching enzyme
MLVVNLTNPDLQRDGHMDLPRNTVHLERAAVVYDGGCHTRLTLRNYELDPVDLVVSVGFEADFADVFEVRGVRREKRGTMHEARVDGGRVSLGYTGLDGVIRRTAISFDRATTALTANRAEFTVHLPPAGRTTSRSRWTAAPTAIARCGSRVRRCRARCAYFDAARDAS